MEAIRKHISTDRGRTHTNGILPYIPYNQISPSMTFVDGFDVDGNYGEYVCDFGKVHSCLCGNTNSFTYLVERICTSGVTFDDNSIEARLRFRDAFSWYNFINNALLHGVYGKVVSHEETIVTAEDCELHDHSCDEGVIFSTETRTYLDVVTNFSELRDKFEFKPVDSRFFHQERENLYRIDEIEEPSSANTVSDDINASTYITDYNIYNNYLETVSAITDNTFVVLLDDYETVMLYENLWADWWNTWFGSNWETTAYGSDYTPSHGRFLPFCENFEKYFLGKCYVPRMFAGSAITGVYVPSYISAGDIYEQKKWFDDRANITTNEVRKEWNDRGGDAYYLFLQSLAPRWILTNTEHDVDGNVEQDRFTFLTPYVSVPLLLTESVDDVWNYKTYEELSSPFSATGIFSGYSVFENSHFVDDFVSGYVESKLDYVTNKKAVNIDGEIGVMRDNVNTSNNIVLYRAIFNTGTSRSNGITVTRHTYKKDGSSEIERVTDECYEEEPPIVSSTAKKVVLVYKRRIQTDPNGDETHNIITNDPDLTGDTVSMDIVTVYDSYEYGWWEFKETHASLMCGDGEQLTPGVSKYRTIPTISNVKNIVPNPSNGDSYYFYPQYDNGVNCTSSTHVTDADLVSRFDLPYKNNTFFDMTFIKTDDTGDLYCGNYIPDSGVTIADGFCTIKYVIGGQAYYNQTSDEYTPVPNTGIHYEEKYPYTEGKKIITIDGMANTDLYYASLDFDANLETVVHEDYRLERLARRARITGMEVGTTWVSGTSIIAPLITDDFNSTQQFDNKTIMRFVIDRGVAAAFETNYKLSECNTLEDLENYSNNFFNI